MTQSYRDLTAAARREAAKATLSGLMTWLGDAGLDAASRLPGLLAEVDQHVAAVLEALCGQGHSLGPVALAGYAAGVRDAATEQGWSVPDTRRLAWSHADWPTVRLLAVASIARTAAYA
ncbi:hypothetical protein Val02_70890 [Virgisporangium aliadipatigenens]|uniref:Uncharacterized protein n=1 Tax=Virgisporangium aliadipatigenens TaxID=741659 RepID=A0A8J4DUM1_9ACTN|nr:DUF6401 family natural product biosynthesis protein [Virgisporangium aliadipatigenens]GIJ50203.1 hypothetical protein Val02_70890 [Virgisporangium aliadipatigenens]